MPGLSGLALTTQETIEILSLYSSAAERIDAVAVEPGWNNIGALPMPVTADIRLDALGSVSDGSLVMTIRLFDTTDGSAGPVSGSETVIASTTPDTQAFSGTFTLLGSRNYQMQCQVVGAAGDGFFGQVARVAPTGI